MKVGCSRITWRQFSVGEEQALSEIADAGYQGAPWPDPDQAAGRPAEIARQVGERYWRHGLTPAPGYVWADFWDKSQWNQILERLRRHAAVARELGLTETFVAAGGSDRVMASGRTRRQAAAHVTAADGLSSEELKWLAEGLNAAAAVTLAEGVKACYHNHVGTVIETAQEIEQLLALTDPAVVFLGPDTGHLAWASIDVVEFCRRQVDRIACLHLKDIVAAVRDEGKVAGWDYATFSDRGVFTELGDGCVDFAGMLSVLSAHDFDGWLIIETDVTQRPSALDSARVSRDNLRALGV
jgi:inosose dehydratase